MDTPPGPDPGLCRTCQHVKRSESHRGSVFWMCTRALVDASWRKYPPLPVRQCNGYQPLHDVAPPSSRHTNES